MAYVVDTPRLLQAQYSHRPLTVLDQVVCDSPGCRIYCEKLSWVQNQILEKKKY